MDAVAGGSVTPWAGLVGPARVSLHPDVDSLQPQWSELLQALSGLGGEFEASDIESDSSLAAFRLESREIEAFRRTVGAEPANIAVEQFILAGAAVRHRLCEDVRELRNLQSKTPVAIPESAWRAARESVRIADAYLKHYSHLAEQAVFDGNAEEARDCLILQHRMSRELSGVLLLLSRLSRQVRQAESPLARDLIEVANPMGNVG